MDDQDASDSPVPDNPDRRGALTRVRHIARRGRKKVSHSLRSRLAGVGEKIGEQMLELMASPKQVEALQKSLVRLTGWTLQRGFEADPNAELLFDFIEWLEERHGRDQIVGLLLRSEWVRDPAFIDALIHLSRLLSPWDTPEGQHWDQQRLDIFKERAGRRLLQLLVDLAALELDEPPPQDLKGQIAYLKSPPLPARFQRLAEMTQGEKLLTRSTSSKRRTLAKRVAQRLSTDQSGPSALIPFIPGIGDETLHFLVFSTTFFLQSYLVRNLIEALPDIAGEVSENLKDNDDDIIDI